MKLSESFHKKFYRGSSPDLLSQEHNKTVLKSFEKIKIFEKFFENEDKDNHLVSLSDEIKHGDLNRILREIHTIELSYNSAMREMQSQSDAAP